MEPITHYANPARLPQPGRPQLFQETICRKVLETHIVLSDNPGMDPSAITCPECQRFFLDYRRNPAAYT